MQQAAADGIKRANHHSRLSGIQHVAQLLSGHQTAAATILAASMGDVRLATLVSQVCNILRASKGVLSTQTAVKLLHLHFGLVCSQLSAMCGVACDHAGLNREQMANGSLVCVRMHNLEKLLFKAQ